MLGALAGFAFTCTASAVCLNPKPSVEQAFRSSAMVAIGIATSRRDVSVPDDPEGVDHTFYQVKLTRVFKGMHGAGKAIRLFSENTSARFDMGRGVSYLLFVTPSANGPYVDNCGWSGALREPGTAATLRQVETIAARERRPGAAR